MTNRSRDKIFELVELKKPLKQLETTDSKGQELQIASSSLKSQSTSEHQYQSLTLKNTFPQSSIYEVPKKIPINPPNSDNKKLETSGEQDLTVENEAIGRKTSGEEWQKVMFFVALLVVVIIALLLIVAVAALIQAAINKNIQEAVKFDTNEQFLATMEEFCRINSTLLEMNDFYQSLLKQVEVLKNETTRLLKLHDTLSNQTTVRFENNRKVIVFLNRSIHSGLQQVSKETSQQIKHNNRSIDMAKESIINLEIKLDSTEIDFQKKINTVTNRIGSTESDIEATNGRISEFSNHHLLGNCSSHNNNTEKTINVAESNISLAVNVTASLTNMLFLPTCYMMTSEDITPLGTILAISGHDATCTCRGQNGGSSIPQYMLCNIQYLYCSNVTLN